eukprot:CAMPEP_0180351876 /NCGR_PEP_ID=MMETSP0989-20121125/6771_1 /TAXON_ID=697907 /ORGANISM="non described non described, Strain CCMP2293" /LENGTH=129 /DNA_ID=CAMNT_0022341365 /DNA_START=609 /DNA_END=994 /DNA_ORIENTATION=+
MARPSATSEHRVSDHLSVVEGALHSRVCPPSKVDVAELPPPVGRRVSDGVVAFALDMPPVVWPRWRVGKDSVRAHELDDACHHVLLPTRARVLARVNNRLLAAPRIGRERDRRRLPRVPGPPPPRGARV